MKVTKECSCGGGGGHKKRHGKKCIETHGEYQVISAKVC
jgi:hypothetical protein